VRRHARQIALVTKIRYMPPWKPEPGYGAFAGERRLTDEQVRLIQQLVDGGLIEGDPNDLSPAPAWTSAWQLGEPDVVVTMPEPYVLRGDGPDIFRTFVIAIPGAVSRYVKGLEFRPGDQRVIHHANLKIDQTRSSRQRDEEETGPGFDGGSGRGAEFPDGHFLGWTPGQVPRMLPEGMAWRLERGSDLVAELHLRPNGKSEKIQISVGLFFTEQPPSRVPYMLRLGRQSIDIPAGEKQYVIADTYVLPVSVDVIGVQPHAHYLAKEVNAYTELPDGTIRSLLYIKDWDFNWQDVYRYAEPVSLPRATKLVMRYTYDNSADNARNPHRPPTRVTFGQTSSSEMGDLWLQVVPNGRAERATLDRDYAPKMLLEDIAGDEKIIEVNPKDARTRVDLALLYLDANRVGDAIGQLEASVEIEPASWVAHYELGRALLTERRLDEAATHLTKTLALKADVAEAHNNLGVVSFLQGRNDEALRSYDEALRLAPDNPEARHNRARTLAAEGKLDDAIRDYRRVLEVRPNDAQAHAGFASVAATQGRLAEAVAHYRQALQINPDLPAALVDLAWIFATTDRADIRAPQDAVRLAERVAELTSYKNATVLDTLAVAYAAAGELNRAVATGQSALDLATSDGLHELAEKIHRRLALYKAQLQR
jgi:tetratricopeptide (TPR) repeat protein